MTVKITRLQAIEIFTGLGMADSAKWSRSKMQQALESLCTTVADDQMLDDPELDPILDELIAAGNEQRPIQIVREEESTPTIQVDEESTEQSLLTDSEMEDEELAVDPVAEEAEEGAQETGDTDDVELHGEIASIPEPAAAPRKRGRPRKNPLPDTAVAVATPLVPKKRGNKGRLKNTNTEPVVTEIREVSNVSVTRRNPGYAGPPAIRITKGRPYWAGVLLKKYGLQVGITPKMVRELDTLCRVENPKESEARLKQAWHAVSGYTSQDAENI